MRRYSGILLGMGIWLFSVTIGYAQDILQIKGSDTLVNLVQRLAEVYMEKNPGRVIAVTGGGSGTGIAALINGKCDIANASRLMQPQEIEQANERGIRPKEVIIAIDALSVITNEQNPVTKLTMDELGKIFRGEITNWKDVGGSELAITLYGRQSNSGTFVFFRDTVLKGDYCQRMYQMNGNAQIVEALKQDISGIGYVGIGYVKQAPAINVLRIALLPGDEYANPLDADDINSGKYPLCRPLNQYINDVPKFAVQDFISFELSQEGQGIVEEEGFLSID